MKKVYFFIFIVFASCLNEEKVDIGNETTFIKYFNGGGNDTAVAFAETEDKGTIILANTSLNGGRIKLIKTDNFGNNVWSKLLPESTDATVTYKASGFEVLPGDAGYVIVGEYIENSSSRLFIMSTSGEGTINSQKAYATPEKLQGKAIVAQKDLSGNVISYVVLANILDSGSENMAVGEVNKTDLSIVWFQNYGAGESTLTNKLFFNLNKISATLTDTTLYWGGGVVREGKSDIRFVKSKWKRKNTDFDLAIGSPEFDETITDICRYGFGYALIGSTNNSSTGAKEIFFKRLSEDGSAIPVNAETFPVKNNEGTEIPGDKEGNSLTVTQDGGLLLLGSVPTDAALNFGRGESDLFLIKINAFGDITWEKSIGSRNTDKGVSVLQASDGGYLILATSVFAGLETVMLIKTDKTGNIK